MKSGAGLAGRATPTSLFIGAVVAVSTIAIGTGLVFFATADGGREGGGSANAADSRSSSTTTTSTSSTTTTTAPPTTTTTLPPADGGTGNGISNGGGPQDPDRAYSDPADPPYEGVPLPVGISATLTPGSCVWDAANGGELQASGTISADANTDDVWFLTVFWLQNERELDDQFEVYELEPGTTMPWRLTTSAPLPPAPPFRCALEVE